MFLHPVVRFIKNVMFLQYTEQFPFIRSYYSNDDGPIKMLTVGLRSSDGRTYR